MNHHRKSEAISTHRFDVTHLRGLPALSLNRLIGFAASTVIGIFIPIFLYEYFDQQIVLVLLWFCIMYALRAPLFVLAAKFFSRTSLILSMIVGTLAWIVHYSALYFLEQYPLWHSEWLIVLSLLAVGVSASFYWTPFNVDFSSFGSKKKRGAEEGIFLAAQRLIGVLTPILGGWLIVTYDYGSTFLVGIILVVSSIIPLFFLKHNPVQYEYGFFETFRLLFSKKYRYLTLSMIGYGAESSVAYVVWPIFLFIVFAGNHFSVGAFATVIVLISMAAQVFLGKYLDHHKKRKILNWGVDFFALGWLIKAFVSTPMGVFFASTFHSFGAILMGTPLSTMLHEKAADAGHYIDEFTTMREIGTTIGRAAMMLLLVAIVSIWSINIAFVAAAAVSLLMSLLGRYKVGQILKKG